MRLYVDSHLSKHASADPRQRRPGGSNWLSATQNEYPLKYRKSVLIGIVWTSL
jgi:hypothetical protein